MLYIILIILVIVLIIMVRSLKKENAGLKAVVESFKIDIERDIALSSEKKDGDDSAHEDNNTEEAKSTEGSKSGTNGTKRHGDKAFDAILRQMIENNKSAQTRREEEERRKEIETAQAKKKNIPWALAGAAMHRIQSERLERDREEEKRRLKERKRERR